MDSREDNIPAMSFNDFSEEVFFTCLQNLEGGREAARLAQVSRIWAEMLGPGSGALWKTFGAQEFGKSNLQAPPAPKDKTLVSIDFTGVDRYASLARAASLKQALWGHVPTSGFGSREGTPWLFIGASGEDIFAFGGYGPMGPANDLMVASLTALKEVLAVSSAGTGSSAAACSSDEPPSGSAGQTRSGADDASETVLPPCASPSTPSARSDSDVPVPRLDFQRVGPKGMSPMRSYGATVTPLVDDEVPNCDWFDMETVRRCVRDPPTAALLPQANEVEQVTLFVVTGGFRSGGYRNESPDWSLGIAFRRQPASTDQSFSPPPRTAGGSDIGPALPNEVLWVKPGPPTCDSNKDGPPNMPTPRSNATAVYVPRRFADPSSYPSGYIMLFGGNADGQGATNSVDVLDLSTFVWQHLGSLPNAPRPRNSHSAILMPDNEEPGSKAKILIFGGGTGRDVPRAGEDLVDFATFDPRTMSWLGPAIVPEASQMTEAQTEGGASRSRPLVPGRAHVAVKVGRSVLFFGGGRDPTNQLNAVLCQQLSENHARRVSAAEDAGESEGAWGNMLRSLKWKNVPSIGNAGPAPRAFHAAVSLAPAGVPVLLTYGGWHPYRGNFGDIWAAKLDPWADGERADFGVGRRAQLADRRFSQQLVATSTQDDEDDEEDAFGSQISGPLVNIGGRIMPLAMFAQLLEMQFGAEEGARRLEELMQQARGGGVGGENGGGDGGARGGDADNDVEDEESEDDEDVDLDDDVAGEP